MGRLLMIGCTNVGRYMIEEMFNNPSIESELVGVVNLNTRRSLTKANYDSYADLAEKYSFPIYYCDNVNEPDCLAFIRSKQPDVIIQTGWSQKFKDELLNIPKYGCIGEHPAPLPVGRGAACVNWAILTGETMWGDTFFHMVSEYDKGEIYAQSRFPICEYDSVYTIYEKVAAAAAKTTADHIDHWTEGRFSIIPQDDTKATYYKKRVPTDGLITSFDQPAKVLHDFIRAQTSPYPCAYVLRGGARLLLLSSAIVHDERTDAAPGTIVALGGGAVRIACANGDILEIIRVRAENKPTCWAEDHAREMGIGVGDALIV